MAASVRYIVAQGEVMGTINHSVTNAFAGVNPFSAALVIYVLTLFLEFVVASGSAKAFLAMANLVPFADIEGLTRQTAVTAYYFGDGFSNMVYSTSPVLLVM